MCRKAWKRRRNACPADHSLPWALMTGSGMLGLGGGGEAECLGGWGADRRRRVSCWLGCASAQGLRPCWLARWGFPRVGKPGWVGCGPGTRGLEAGAARAQESRFPGRGLGLVKQQAAGATALPGCSGSLLLVVSKPGSVNPAEMRKGPEGDEDQLPRRAQAHRHDEENALVLV